MKQFTWLVLIIGTALLPALSKAQTADTTIRITSGWSEISEFKDLLNFEGLEYQKIKFSSPLLKGKRFSIRALEIWKGEVKDSAVLETSARNKPIKDSTFEVRVISKIDEQKNIRLHLHMPEAMVRKAFKTIPAQAELYSLRMIAKERKQPVVLKEPFYLMAYILPIPMPGKPGWLSYCNVDNSGEDVRAWGEKLGIPHYIVFELIFF
ncbi:hypothetical protein [Chitinophaga defluvii]|uniref:Uncharacterized protein n=1 Tax=Chitinophaga defluvii TaxID=3163343 RepID=A0ABV2TAS4_9BACT